MSLGLGLSLGLYRASITRSAPLDRYASMVFDARSYRLLLSSAANLPCFRARRSSDNAQMDVGFKNGWADVFAGSAFATWVGANSAYVVTHYDQSPAGRHYTNAATAAQPQIVNAGTLTGPAANRPAALWSASSRLNSAVSTVWSSGPMQTFSVFSTDAAANRHLYVHAAAGTAGVFISPYRASALNDWLAGDCAVVGNGVNVGRAPRAIATTPGIANSALRQMTTLMSAGESSIRIDGASKTLRSSLVGAVPAVSGTSYFGAASTGDGIAGYFSEFIMLAGAVDPAIIEANQKAIWGTP